MKKYLSGNKKVLGTGNPPLGWPASIPWTQFKGISRSKLTNQQLTLIIIEMYRAIGLDPETFVRPPTSESSESLDPEVTEENERDDDDTNDKENEDPNNNRADADS